MISPNKIICIRRYLCITSSNRAYVYLGAQVKILTQFISPDLASRMLSALSYRLVAFLSALFSRVIGELYYRLLSVCPRAPSLDHYSSQYSSEHFQFSICNYHTSAKS